MLGYANTAIRLLAFSGDEFKNNLQYSGSRLPQQLQAFPQVLKANA